MSFLFYECSSLKELPDISKWNVNNVIALNGLFFNCFSLISLPDISKWNIFNSYINNFISYLEPIINSTDEDEIKKVFELSSFLNKTYKNDLYLENVKIQIFEPKSSDKEEYKKLVLSKVYNMNSLFAGCH